MCSPAGRHTGLPLRAQSRKVLTGNHAASHAVLLSRAQVIAAYPITPQTQIVELLSQWCADGSLRAKFIKVESEHSAMAACIGASAAGVRTFTATSSHGLALMHEMLHWAAGARLSIVMANVNRAMGPPWSIWTDQNDSLSQRDTGWMQLYCESNQEVLDTVIQAYRVAETVLLPTMIVLDAFVLSHTAEPVEIPEQSVVDGYLPRYDPPHKLNVAQPSAFGGLAPPEAYMELRHGMQRSMEEALLQFQRADEAFAQLTGRRYGLVEGYRLDNADLVLVTSGTVTSTAREVIDVINRSQGVGLLKIRLFRPFPAEAVRRALARARKVAVIDRNISFGHGGIFAQEVKSALHNHAQVPVLGYIAGLGGRDITPEVIQQIVTHALTHDEERDLIWVGLKP